MARGVNIKIIESASMTWELNPPDSMPNVFAAKVYAANIGKTPQILKWDAFLSCSPNPLGPLVDHYHLEDGDKIILRPAQLPDSDSPNPPMPLAA